MYKADHLKWKNHCTSYTQLNKLKLTSINYKKNELEVLETVLTSALLLPLSQLDSGCPHKQFALSSSLVML